MKIFGIGTDIVSIVRIKKSIKNKRFVTRVYNVKEISKCKNLIKSEHCFAKRFAAKEAFSKALGTGISNGINLNEIIVKNNNSGKPYFNFEGNTKKLLKKKFKNQLPILNVGTNDELSIKNLSKLILELIGYKGLIKFDKKFPDGTYRKKLNTKKINQLGWYPKIQLKKSLKKVIENRINQYS